MSQIPENLKYTESHEWIRVQDDTGTVGITEHAQKELSDVVFIELPKIGRVVKAKEPVAVVESVKAASDIYAPVSGEITAVNNSLAADPSLVNSHPYDDGWLFKIKIASADELNNLKSAQEYKALIGE